MNKFYDYLVSFESSFCTWITNRYGLSEKSAIDQDKAAAVPLAVGANKLMGCAFHDFDNGSGLACFAIAPTSFDANFDDVIVGGVQSSTLGYKDVLVASIGASHMARADKTEPPRGAMKTAREKRFVFLCWLGRTNEVTRSVTKLPFFDEPLDRFSEVAMLLLWQAKLLGDNARLDRLIVLSVDMSQHARLH